MKATVLQVLKLWVDNIISQTWAFYDKNVAYQKPCIASMFGRMYALKHRVETILRQPSPYPFTKRASQRRGTLRLHIVKYGIMPSSPLPMVTPTTRVASPKTRVKKHSRKKNVLESRSGSKIILPIRE